MNVNSQRSAISNDDIDALLEKIRINCIQLSDAHKEHFLQLSNSLKWYKIPVILISGISSLVSVSQNYFPQENITICTGIFGLSASLIVSIELYLGISHNMGESASLTKDYYALATDIYKTLSLNAENRTENSLTYLESTYGTYTSLCTNSPIIVKQIEDRLIKIPINDLDTPSNRLVPSLSLTGLFSRPNSHPTTPRNSV